MSDVRLVVVVVFDEVALLDAVGPIDVFAAARELTDGDYRIVVASVDGNDVRSLSGVTIPVDRALDGFAEPIDTLIVAGGVTVPEAASNDARLTGAVRAAAERSRRVCCVCTGAFILGAAGLLDGRRVTTHWWVASALQKRLPNTDVDADRMYIQDGRIHTSAGGTGGIDLCLAMVEDDHGAHIARTVARYLVVFLQRPGGQAQFAAYPEVPVDADSPLRPVLDAIAADPTADHGLSKLADTANMSERHLTRLFAQHTGYTPARYVEVIRVQDAQRLLEDTRLSIAQIATRSGFGSVETLRRAFLRVRGILPSAYRDRFRSAH